MAHVDSSSLKSSGNSGHPPTKPAKDCACSLDGCFNNEGTEIDGTTAVDAIGSTTTDAHDFDDASGASNAVGAIRPREPTDGGSVLAFARASASWVFGSEVTGPDGFGGITCAVAADCFGCVPVTAFCRVDECGAMACGVATAFRGAEGCGGITCTGAAGCFAFDCVAVTVFSGADGWPAMACGVATAFSGSEGCGGITCTCAAGCFAFDCVAVTALSREDGSPATACGVATTFSTSDGCGGSAFSGTGVCFGLSGAGSAFGCGAIGGVIGGALVVVARRGRGTSFRSRPDSVHVGWRVPSDPDIPAGSARTAPTRNWFRNHAPTCQRVSIHLTIAIALHAHCGVRAVVVSTQPWSLAILDSVEQGREHEHAPDRSLDRLLHHVHVLQCGPRSWRTHYAASLPRGLITVEEDEVTSADQKTVVLGAEYDDRLRTTLREVLKTLATSEPRHEWIPDLETLDVDIEGRTIHVEAETYIGLSISGPADLVDRISEMVKQRSSDS